MTIKMKSKSFESFFEIERLEKCYSEKIAKSMSSGIDNVTHEIFSQTLERELTTINRKVLNDKYRFTNYKLKLISKGRGKIPREISIPTIRDRITLRCLCDYLLDTYKESITQALPQQMIKDVISTIDEFDTFIKLDVKDFYPSIRHNILSSILETNIPKNACRLIMAAVSTPTVSCAGGASTPSFIGVPQGTSISNILAYIYLFDTDKKYHYQETCKYFRYVDDILVLCQHSDSHNIADSLKSDFVNLGLNTHEITTSSEKSKIGSTTEKLSYLGYELSYKNHKRIISSRKSSVDNLKNSLASIFTSYKYAKDKRIEYLNWRLHLRITGCIYEKQCKGWLFFFSEMNDFSQLYILDNYVKKLIARYKVPASPPSFSKAIHEIKHNRYESKTIMNYDLFDVKDMRKFLIEVFGIKNIAAARDSDIEALFHKKMRRETTDLLVDIQSFS